MPIASSDIKYYKTTNNLGGAKTANEVANATLAEIFANTSSAEALTGSVRFACIYVENTHASLTLSVVKQWLVSNTPSTDTHCQIGLGSSGVDGTEQTITDENDAPTGVTFSDAIDEDNAILLPDLAAGEHQAIWIRWETDANAAAINVDNAVIRIKGDTPV